MDTSIYHKWKGRSRVGVYLGQSPQHARDISLVLSLETGLVSPQFHVKLDSTFQTLREEGIQVLPSQWQHKCNFATKGPQAKGTAPEAEKPAVLPLPNGPEPASEGAAPQEQEAPPAQREPPDLPQEENLMICHH